MIPSEAIEIRSFHEADHSFIYSTWLRNYKHSSYFAKRIRPATFFKGHHAIVTHLMAKPTVQIFIAHPKDDPDTILGYLACELSERPTIHFVFVKEAFRMLGLAKTMLLSAKINVERAVFTHWTYPVDEFMRKWPDMIYDPYGL